MSNVLVIESSARQSGSISRQLTAQFVSQWQAAHPEDSISLRDLAQEPAPHLDASLLGGWLTAPEQHSALEREAFERSERLTNEVLAADVLVLGAPMYNFGIPSTLKAWFDHVLRAGVTFRYTADGPVGLLSGKRAVVLTARGGLYAGVRYDHQEPYLRELLEFIGIQQVDFVHAEGLNLGDEAQQQGLQAARARIAALT